MQMISKQYRFTFFLLVLVSLANTSCKKYLETKSVENLATPTTLNDLEAILNSSLINVGTVLLNGSTDEYYYSYTDWLSRATLPKQGYVWDEKVNNYNDWRDQYRAAFYANTVLYNLDLIDGKGDLQRVNNIKGAALFYRALAFNKIAQLYSPQYDLVTASSDLGIPLRLSADINDVSIRASVAQTYDQIITDLSNAVALLSDNLPNNTVYKTRPTKAAVLGLMARVYLQMGNFAKAKENANACLNMYNVLMDFNDKAWVDVSLATPFKRLNPEVIFHSMTDVSPNSNNAAKVDTVLYKSYDANDLRKTAYVNGTQNFKGTYTSSTSELFSGIATDEIMLIRAECFAREGNKTEAMNDLNNLLRTRWKKVSGVSTYVDQTATDANDALAKVITERKKELVFREIRWADLKRLNKESLFATTIKRNLNGQETLLVPNDFRYSLLIPVEVLSVVNLPQNSR